MSQVENSLGATIRAVRKEKGLTLTHVAQAAGLSHPFLSQVERGQSQPSMRSLYLIATALGTTQQALLAASAPECPAEDGQFVAGMRVISSASATADISEYSAVPTHMTDFFVHKKDEYLYVVAGNIEVEVTTDPSNPAQSTITQLGYRESVHIPGAHHHRYRSTGPVPAIVLAVHSQPRA